MTEYPELFEKIDLLDKEMDVQAALLEKLNDTVAYLVEAVLQLERTRVVRRPKPQNKKGHLPPSVPLPQGETDEGCAAEQERS